MKYIITISITAIIIVMLFNIQISPKQTNALKVEVDIYGSVQVFEYKGVTCLTWKNGYAGGMSCLATENFN